MTRIIQRREAGIMLFSLNAPAYHAGERFLECPPYLGPRCGPAEVTSGEI